MMQKYVTSSPPATMALPIARLITRDLTLATFSRRVDQEVSRSSFCGNVASRAESKLGMGAGAGLWPLDLGRMTMTMG